MRSRWLLVLWILLVSCEESHQEDPAVGHVRGEVAAIADRLASSGGDVSHEEVAADLDRLRAFGTAARSAGPVLCSFVIERAALYRGRGPNEATRLRGYVLATLVDVGPPPEAIPVLRELLLLEQSPHLLAAAARAAGAIGSGASGIAGAFERLLDPAFADDLVCLDRYNVLPTPENGTTARIEALRALERIGTAPPEVLARVQALAAAPTGRFGAGDRLQAEARRALSILRPREAAEHSCCESEGKSLRTGIPDEPLIPREKRQEPALAAVSVTDQDGVAATWRELFDRPAALCFFYTQCDNPRKCSATVASMGSLQRLLKEARLQDRTRLVLMTMDPATDTMIVRRRYAELRGFQPTRDSVVAGASDEAVQEVVGALGVNANFGQGRISIHGVELFVLDDRGRVARRHRGPWREEDVVRDLRFLVHETEGSTTRPGN